MNARRFFCVLLIFTTVLSALAMPATAALRPARNPEDGALYGYGDDGIAELQYNARYLFEQSILPKTVFEYEKETIDYINAFNTDKMRENILTEWEYAAATVILNDLKLSGGETPETADSMWAYVEEKRPELGMGDEHVTEVAIEALDGNTKAIVIATLDTGWVPLSTFIGIAHNEAAGLKYFILERSFDLFGDGNAPYMFCFVGDGVRGSYYAIENDRQAFVDAVLDVMTNALAPGASSQAQ